MIKLKRCRSCGVVKKMDEFYFHPLTRDRLQVKCKECLGDYMKERYRKPGKKEQDAKVRKKWSEQNPNYQRDRRVLSKYRMTAEEYDKMFEKQNGVCIHCEMPEKRKSRMCCVYNERLEEVVCLACRRCNKKGFVKGYRSF